MELIPISPKNIPSVREVFSFLDFGKLTRIFKPQEAIQAPRDIVSPRVNKIFNEIKGSTEEEMEMIKLRVLHECRPKHAVQPTEEEVNEINEALEFLASKNRYLQVQPRTHQLSDGSIVSPMNYDE